MDREVCPVCGKGKLRRVRGTYESQFLGRDGGVHNLAVPDVVWDECSECKEAFLDDAASHQIEAARRQAQGLLAPADIRRLRSALCKTQREMSRLLGIGEKTYCRWESGAYVQSAAFDRYLRLLISNPENVDILERLDAGEEQPFAQGLVFRHLAEMQPTDEVVDAFTASLVSGQWYLARGVA